MTQTSRDEAAVEIKLPERLDLGSSKQIRTDIEAARGSPVRLKADTVQFVGGAGAEVLLAAHAEWEAKGLDLQIVDHSDQMLKGLAQLGLAHALLPEKDTV